MPQVQTKFKTMYLVSQKPDIKDETSSLKLGGNEKEKNEISPSVKPITQPTEKVLEKPNAAYTQTNPMTFNCTKCSYNTTNFADYKDHFYSHSKSEKINSSQNILSSEKKDENCEKCDEETNSKIEVKKNPKTKKPTPRYYPFPKITRIKPRKNNS